MSESSHVSSWVDYSRDRYEGDESMQDAIGEAIMRVRENCASRYIVWVGGIDDHFDTLTEALQARDKWLDKGYTHVQVEVTRG